MNFLEIVKLWTLTVIMTAINQRKTSGSYIFDKYFKGTNGKPILGNTATIKIKKGSSIVLRAIAQGADRLVKNTDNIYELTIKLPRFGLRGKILAHEINELESLESKAKVTAASLLIKEILQEHVDDYMTTLEYMAIGALFGKVIDGDGVVLFEFITTADPIEYKNQDHITVLDLIDDALEEELGKEVPYEVLASPTFITRVAAAAKAAGEFNTGGEAKWLDEEGKRILVRNSKRYIPFRASWRDENGDKHQFIADGEAVVIPLGLKVFKHAYGRADHTDAMKTTPQLFFAAPPEKLQSGKGWAIETESKPMVWCDRPGALIKLKYSA